MGQRLQVFFLMHYLTLRNTIHPSLVHQVCRHWIVCGEGVEREADMLGFDDVVQLRGRVDEDVVDELLKFRQDESVAKRTGLEKQHALFSEQRIIKHIFEAGDSHQWMQERHNTLRKLLRIQPMEKQLEDGGFDVFEYGAFIRLFRGRL